MAAQSENVMTEKHSTVLIVDDEPPIIEFLRMGFRYEGFAVFVATNGAEALKIAAEQKPAIVILDIMMPGMNGIEVARRLHATSDTAIIMLTAKETVDDRIAGLDGGADDYITKPFVFRELMARVRAVLRRQGKQSGDVLTFQAVTLHRSTRVVTYHERQIELTPREFDLLEFFLMHPRQVLTHDAILTRVWGYEYDGDDNVIAVYIRHLRDKLGDNPPNLLQSVRGVGYVLRG